MVEEKRLKRFWKYPDIEHLGSDDNKDILVYGDDLIIIEEKVDGGNGSFWLDEESGNMHEGSRHRNLVTDLDEKTFIKQRTVLRKLIEPQKLNPDYIYYVEWMAPHTLRYTNVPDFIGLDIRQKRSMKEGEDVGCFLGRELREQEFTRLGIENVPLVWKGTAKELKELEVLKLIPKSKYFDGFAEGIVIKNYSRLANVGNHQLYAKVVRAEFKEENKAVFGGLKKKDTDTSKIVETFATEARIRKAVLKFVNEDNKPLERGLMKLVPSYVIKDILKEEYSAIFDEYKFIGFKEMKQLVSKKCLFMIDKMLLEKAEVK